VTDDDGATGTDTAIVTVTEAPTNTMHVVSIVMSTTKYKDKGWFTYATATVKIVVKNARGTFTFTVTGVEHHELTYDPDANEEASDSITV
jgi:hypothetical protein